MIACFLYSCKTLLDKGNQISLFFDCNLLIFPAAVAAVAVAARRRQARENTCVFICLRVKVACDIYLFRIVENYRKRNRHTSCYLLSISFVCQRSSRHVRFFSGLLYITPTPFPIFTPAPLPHLLFYSYLTTNNRRNRCHLSSSSFLPHLPPPIPREVSTLNSR